jgi:hypothetical protein
MPATAIGLRAPRTIAIEPGRLEPNPFSLSLYGDPAAEIDDLLSSIREHGVLVALVVAPGSKPGTWESFPDTGVSPARWPWVWPRSLVRSAGSRPVWHAIGRSWNTIASAARRSVN